MSRAEGHGRAVRFLALTALTLGACIPAALSLEPGDAGAGGGDSSSSDGTGVPSSDAGPGSESAPPDSGSLGDATNTGDTGTDTGTTGDATSTGDTGSAGDASGTTDVVTGNTCSGGTCVAAVPPGWTLVAFDPDSRGPCPSGYGTPTDVIVDPSDLGPPMCSCSCAVTSPPSCTSGTAQLSYGSGGTCTSGELGLAVDGACVSMSLAFAADDHEVTPIPASGGSCTPNVTVTPRSPGGGLGKACMVSGGPGGGCSGSQVCAPAGSTLFGVCIQQTGVVSCPPAYPTQHVTGTGLNPGACSACMCAGPTATCTNATFTVYSDGACQTSIATLPADGACHAVTAGTAGDSYEYTAGVANAACTVSQEPMPTSSSSLVTPTTVCCP